MISLTLIKNRFNHIHKNSLIRACVAAVVGFGAFFSIRMIILSRLPFNQVHIPSLGLEEQLEIPPRPGIQGIVISGPRIEPLIFSIDLAKAGVRALDWEQLRLTDPNTDVKLTCRIDESGYLSFSLGDVLMEGHTEAGMIIQNAMKTWFYTPYKIGRIRFWFNLPSRGEKLIIDTRGLVRKETIPDQIPIYDGKLHYIEGISTRETRVEG